MIHRKKIEGDLELLVEEYDLEIIQTILTSISVCDFSLSSPMEIVDWIMENDDDAIEWIALTARILNSNNGVFD